MANAYTCGNIDFVRTKYMYMYLVYKKNFWIDDIHDTLYAKLKLSKFNRIFIYYGNTKVRYNHLSTPNYLLVLSHLFLTTFCHIHHTTN